MEKDTQSVPSVCLECVRVYMEGRGQNILQWQLLPEPFGEGHGGKGLPWEPPDNNCVTVTAVQGRIKERKWPYASTEVCKGEKMCNEPHIPTKTSRHLPTSIPMIKKLNDAVTYQYF